MMNRQQRRAAARGASIDKDFDNFRARGKRTFAELTDRELGVAWMRGQQWSASGADAMLIHKVGDAPQRRTNDIRVSATYGPMHFRAFISLDLLWESIAGWQGGATEWIATVEQQTGRRHDIRELTRHAILKELITHSHVQDEAAAALTAMLAWLVATGPAGEFITSLAQRKSDSPCRPIHYEITDITDAAGRPSHNFRLVLGTWEDDEPLPDCVHTLPSPFDATPKDDD